MDKFLRVINRQRSFPVSFEPRLNGENLQYGYGRGESTIESKEGQAKFYRRSYSDSKVGQKNPKSNDLRDNIIKQAVLNNPFQSFHMLLLDDDNMISFDNFKQEMEKRIKEKSKLTMENKYYEELRTEWISSAMIYYKKNYKKDYKYICKNKKIRENLKKAIILIKAYKYVNELKNKNNAASQEDWDLLYTGVMMEYLQVNIKPHGGQVMSVDD